MAFFSFPQLYNGIILKILTTIKLIGFTIIFSVKLTYKDLNEYKYPNRFSLEKLW